MRALQAVDFAEMTMVSSFYIKNRKISGSYIHCRFWDESLQREEIMELVRNIERSIIAYNANDYVAALNFATLAVDATAQRFYKTSISRNKYKNFIRKYYWLLERFTGLPKNAITQKYPNIQLFDEHNCNIGGELGSDIADIIYHIFRCNIHHGKGIPLKYQLTPNMGLSNIMLIGENNDVVMLPATLITGLWATCLFCKSNSGLGKDSNFYITFDSSVVVSCDVQINEKDKIIQLCPLIKKGCVLKFDLAKYFGKENEIKQIFSTIPQQTAINKKIFSQGGKYSLKVERKYI